MVLFVVISSLTIDYILYDLLGLPLPEDELSKSQMLLPSLFSTLAIASIYEAAYYIAQWKRSIEETERLKRENTISQLDSLRNQVNPHFLFNSLNTLANLIPEDGEKAVEFVQMLARVYRHILEIGERELISLREELEAINAYSFLVQTRFGDNLRINIDIPDVAYHKHIVPLSVQMLLENAIKHNVVSTKRPLLIEIFCDQQGDLVVRNNLQKKAQVNDSTGVGLKNISNRYQLVSNKSIDIIVSERHYTVVLPLLEVQEYAHLDH
jgi:LytS/YehU family sensor histidine kinase